MKITSEYIKRGTKCKVRRDFRDADRMTKVLAGEIVTIRQRSILKPLVVCENADGELIHIPSQLLKRIKPEPVVHTVMVTAPTETVSDPPAKLKVGDWVEVIGPSNIGAMVQVGERGEITTIGCKGNFWVKTKNAPMYYPASSLRPCDPPAKSTVPDGCPVDEQCHREMTAAGWEWDEIFYKQFSTALHLSGDVSLRNAVISPAGWVAIGKGITALAAWRERSKA